MDLNKVYLLGALARDPEVHATHSGHSVVRALVTVSRDFFSKERNARVRETDSVEVQAWGRSGELMAQQLRRGSPVFIEGRLKLDSWETPTGEKRQRLIVHVENFAAVGSGRARPPIPAHVAASAQGAAPATGDKPAVGTEAGAPGEALETEEGEVSVATGLPGPIPGAPGRRKRRRRGRGPRRDGIPPGPAAPVTQEERAAFSAGIAEASAAAPGEAPSSAAPASEAAPAPAPLPPSPPPAPPAERKPVPNVSLKEDMPF